jgi:alpha-D-ribose 1-methylphosphonate 5-triphosphate synthase subunit PhnL
MNTLIEVRDLSKTFTLHQQNGVVLNVLRGVDFSVAAGECLVLHGQSGAGKSTLLRTLYGNYLPAGGSIRVQHDGQWLELVGAEPRDILQVRQRTLGYVSQFLRVIPRVACLDVVMEPAWPVAGQKSWRKRAPNAAHSPEHSATPLAIGARHLFRWRTAASQYRPRVHGGLAGDVARRADSLTRRQQSPGGVGTDE